jgi:serine/threonine protein kinase
VGDLGLVRGEGLKTLTATGMILGTPRYMAPEMARGEQPPSAADSFALGVMFYELLEGESPFPRGEDAGRLGVAGARGEISPFRRAANRFPESLLSSVWAALSLDPEDRPGDLGTWVGGMVLPSGMETHSRKKESEETRVFSEIPLPPTADRTQRVRTFPPADQPEPRETGGQSHGSVLPDYHGHPSTICDSIWICPRAMTRPASKP